jgi:3'-5' exonuclease
MGMNNDDGYRRSLVFDLETYRIDNAEEFVDLGQFAAPSNWKDPEKIAANIKEQQIAALGKCALDPDLCRIVALGLFWSEGNHDVLTERDGDEAWMLKQFWDAIGPYPYPRLIGFNVIGFDLPVIVRRSQYLGVKTKPIQMGRYRHPDVDDLMTILNFDGTTKTHGLKFYAKRFGITVDDAVDGKDIAALVAAGEWDKVTSHCRSDLFTTAALARKLGILSEQPEMVL